MEKNIPFALVAHLVLEILQLIFFKMADCIHLGSWSQDDHKTQKKNYFSEFIVLKLFGKESHLYLFISHLLLAILHHTFLQGAYGIHLGFQVQHYLQTGRQSSQLLYHAPISGKEYLIHASSLRGPWYIIFYVCFFHMQLVAILNMVLWQSWLA